tara:strand:+ start:1515 stop:2330 length:816 start_codon:yes stop_codon:yes gene_type:complete
MKTGLIFLISTLSWFSFGQDSLGYTWNFKGALDVKEGALWEVDAFENTYASNGGLINKYNQLGELQFSQSIKRLGSISQLVLINTMKLIHFSEEQQTLCYFDNTLSEMDDCVELSDQGVINASLVCGSSQPNKIWVLDNLNSTLSLFSLDKLIQEQQISNLKGTLNIENVSDIKEHGSRLYLLDKTQGIYVFDLYGSFIDFIQRESIQQFEVVGSTLYTLAAIDMKISSIDTEEEISVKLPIDKVLDFQIQNGTFYLRTKNSVHKFELLFH